LHEVLVQAEHRCVDFDSRTRRIVQPLERNLEFLDVVYDSACHIEDCLRLYFGQNDQELISANSKGHRSVKIGRPRSEHLRNLRKGSVASFMPKLIVEPNERIDINKNPKVTG
jgi:hypothetical protein